MRNRSELGCFAESAYITLRYICVCANDINYKEKRRSVQCKNVKLVWKQTRV